MITKNGWKPNVTWQYCRHWHPECLSCAEAKAIADEAKAKRIERSLAAVADDECDKWLTPDVLALRYAKNGENHEHPDFGRELWREDVFNEITLMGYWEWVKERIINRSLARENGYETNSL